MNKIKASKILGLDIPFTEKELKKKYYQLCKKFHPDITNKNDYFLKINDAYNYLLSCSRNSSREINNKINNSSFYTFCRILKLYLDKVLMPNGNIRLAYNTSEKFASIYDYQQMTLPQDSNLTVSQRKLLDYFISLFTEFYGEYKNSSYAMLMYRNLVNTPKFKKIFQNEKQMTILFYNVFKQIPALIYQEDKINHFKELNKKIIMNMARLKNTAAYFHNNDIREYSNYLYKLISAFEGILIIISISGSSAFIKTA
ncbi:MAG TPA: DnaJ domain-containing protein [Spirochaetota bacterium]|nr:DnaJ domain-containing protein [Spirochaetota bacterium]